MFAGRAVPLRFGPTASSRTSRQRAPADWKPTIVHNGAIALDIDEPADLTKFIKRHSDTRSFSCSTNAARSGIAIPWS